MNESKEKSAVGIAVPATENMRNNSTDSVSETVEKIKHKICQSAKEHGEIVDFQTITNNSFIIEYRDGEKQWYCNVDSDSIAAIYDIVKKLMY